MYHICTTLKSIKKYIKKKSNFKRDIINHNGKNVNLYSKIVNLYIMGFLKSFWCLFESTCLSRKSVYTATVL